MKKEKGGRILAGAMALGILFSGAACGKTYKPEPLSDKTRNLAGTLAADAGKRMGKSADFYGGKSRVFHGIFQALFSGARQYAGVASLGGGSPGDDSKRSEGGYPFGDGNGIGRAQGSDE